MKVVVAAAATHDMDREGGWGGWVGPLCYSYYYY